jgi:hypothetical protein
MIPGSVIVAAMREIKLTAIRMEYVILIEIIIF